MWKSGDSPLPIVCLKNNVSKSHNLLDLKQHNVFWLFVLLPALHPLALPIDTSCSLLRFSSLFPSSWVSDIFATWCLSRHSHHKLLSSEAKVKIVISIFATITTSAGAAFKNALHCQEETVPASSTGAQFTRRATGNMAMKANMEHVWKVWSPIQALPPHQLRL